MDNSITSGGESAKTKSNVSAINKRQVLEEAKLCFTATPVKTKKLVESLTKCLYILFQGERLSQPEATDLFFHIIRLFQYKEKDITLRRLTYIGIKALSQQAENVYVVTSSLTTDVSSSRDDPAIRASALRALTHISQNSPPTFGLIEDHLKQSLTNKQPVMVSAALSSLMKIAQVNHEFLHKFTREIHQALQSNSQMVQYHALSLRYYQACKAVPENSAVSSLINICLQEDLIKTPLATCLLIRIISKFVDENEGSDTRAYRDFIKNLLSSDNGMVEFEAAQALVNLKTISSESKGKRLAVSHLRNFLTSNKTALRFASVRTLNQLAAASFAADFRFWSVHRIGAVCKLHLLNKRYRIGDHIMGILDFSNSNTTCAKYTVMLQCEESQQYELKQEFSLGLERSDFMITIPNLLIYDQGESRPITTIATTATTSSISPSSASVLHCVLSFLFYIADKNYPKTLFEDKAGTIELGPSELDTKLFSCDFPIAIHS